MPGVPTLTAVRVIVPGGVVVAVFAAAGGAPIGSVLALLAPALVAALLVGAGDTGRIYVQASAYGDEQRFPLRPPLGYLAAAVVSWAVWVTAVVVAPLAWAAGAWVVAGIASVVAIGDHVGAARHAGTSSAGAGSWPCRPASSSTTPSCSPRR